MVIEPNGKCCDNITSSIICLNFIGLICKTSFRKTSNDSFAIPEYENCLNSVVIYDNIHAIWSSH